MLLRMHYKFYSPLDSIIGLQLCFLVFVLSLDQKPSPSVAHAPQKARSMGPTVSSFGAISPRVTSAPTTSTPAVSAAKLPPSVGSPLALPAASSATTSPVVTALVQSNVAPPQTPPRKHRGLPTPPTVHRVVPQITAKVGAPNQVPILSKLNSVESAAAKAVTSHISTATVSVTPGPSVSPLRVPPPIPTQQAKPTVEPVANTVPVTRTQQARSPTGSQKAPSITSVAPVKTVPSLTGTKFHVPEEPVKPPSVSPEPRMPPPVAPKPLAATPSVPIMLHIPPFKSSNAPLSPTSPTKPTFPSPPNSPMYKPSSPTSSAYMVTSFISMPPSSPTKETPQLQPPAPVVQTVPTIAIVPAASPIAQTVPTRVLVKSVTPGKDGRFTPGGRITPSGRDSTTLRQGVPQKPYTFLDEKTR